jgi:hypothetical protein
MCLVYAGGGGGAPGGTGGTGGGGAGASNGTGNAGTNGLGGGGGGSYGSTGYDSGAGGNGTVIISFLTTIPVTAIGAITGTPAVGSVLTVGSLTPSGAAGNVNYQWQESATSGGIYSNISGATSSTYTVSGSYAGDYIEVQVTGTGNYSGTVNSAYVGPVAIPVSGITVTGAGSATNVVIGNTLQMSAAVLPANATNSTVSWSVTNGTEQQQINSSTGLLTATGVGTVTVTASATDGSGITGTEQITVIPSWSAGPSDGGAYSGAPVNVGSNVVFTATATSTPDSYYLAICKTNSITANANAAPTCGGGSWCITSGYTSSGSQASCSYTTQAGDGRSNVWYGFVCDYNASPVCSSSSQGSGNNSSPFYVNHAPTFSATSNNGPVNPGSSVTFTATASPDSGDTSVTLYVCKTAAFNGSSCTGGQWCNSSAVSSNPSCSYTTGYTDGIGAINYYAYIVDNYGFQSTSNPISSSFTINDIPPVASNVSIANASPIVLTSGDTTTVTANFTVTDNNGCTNIDSGLTKTTAKFYRTALGVSCTPNNANCYAMSCTQDIGSCTGLTATYTCTAPVQFYADPTDSTATNYPNTTWSATAIPADSTGANIGGEASATAIMGSLTAFNATTSINYTSLGLASNTGTTDYTTEIDNEGNRIIDVEVDGYAQTSNDGNAMKCAIGTIPISYEKYSLSSGQDYTTQKAPLTGTATQLSSFDLNPGASAKKYIYWGIATPASGVGSSCSGKVDLTVVDH